MKNLLFLTVILLSLSDISYAQTGERMIASRLTGARFVDSSSYSYSGTRGALGKPAFVGVDYDQMVFYRTDSLGIYTWSQQVQTFDAYNRLIEYHNMDLVNSTLRNNYRRVYNYDNSGHKTSVENYTWDTINAAWQWQCDTIYTYDTYDRVTSALLRDSTFFPVLEHTRDTLIYDSYGNLTSDTTRAWNSVTWVPSLYNTYTYNSANQLLMWTGYSWYNASWRNSAKTSNTYDSAGDLVYREDYASGGGSFWILYDADSAYYDSMHRLTLNIPYSNTPSGGQNILSRIDSSYYYYDAYGNYDSVVIAYISERQVEQFWYEAVATGITEIKKDLATRVYPNPARGPFTVAYDAEQSGAVSLILYDLEGRLISTTRTTGRAGSNTIDYDALRLSPGVYIYELNIPGSTGRGKVAVE